MRTLTSLFVLLFVLPVFAQQHTGSEKVMHHQAVKQTRSAEAVWANLMAGNERFVAGYPRLRHLAAEREAVVTSQHPEVIVLSCADSRVPPELLFDKTIGELFVVRVAGNLAGSYEVASIEYAVEHLGSSMLVVLGHQSCGAVTAACSGGDPGTPSLQQLMKTIAPACQSPNGASKEKALQSSIEHNVTNSVDALEQSELLREAVKEGKLTIVKAYYSLDTGRVTRLK